MRSSSLILSCVLLASPSSGADLKSSLQKEIRQLEAKGKYEAAIKKYRELIQIDPNPRNGHFARLLTDYQYAGRSGEEIYADIEKFLAAAHGKKRGAAYLRAKLAILERLHVNGKDQRMVDAYRNLLALKPKDNRVRNKFAEALTKIHAFEEALQEYRALISKVKRHHASHYHDKAAALSFALGRKDEAIGFWRKRYEFDLLGLAETAARHGLLDVARKTYEQALFYGEPTCRGHRQGGFFFLNQGDVARGFSILSEAATACARERRGHYINHSYREAVEEKVFNRSAGLLDLREIFFQKAMDQDTNILHFYEYLRILNDLKLDGAAIAYCRSVLKKAPGNILVRLELIRYLRAKGLLAESLREYEHLARIDSRNEFSYRMGTASELLQAQGGDAAIAYIRRSWGGRAGTISHHEKMLRMFMELGLVDGAARETSALESLAPAKKAAYRRRFINFCYDVAEEISWERNDRFSPVARFKARLHLFLLEPELHAQNLNALGQVAYGVTSNPNDSTGDPSLVVLARIVEVLTLPPRLRDLRAYLLGDSMLNDTDKSVASTAGEVAGDLLAMDLQPAHRRSIADFLFALKAYERALPILEEIYHGASFSTDLEFVRYIVSADMVGSSTGKKLREQLWTVIDEKRAWESFKIARMLYRHGYKTKAESIWNRIVDEESGDGDIMSDMYRLYGEVYPEQKSANGQHGMEKTRWKKKLFVMETALRNDKFQGFSRGYFIQERPKVLLHLGEFDRALNAYMEYAELKKKTPYPRHLSRFHVMAMATSAKYRTPEKMSTFMRQFEKDSGAVSESLRQSLEHQLDWLFTIEGIPVNDEVEKWAALQRLKLNPARALAADDPKVTNKAIAPIEARVAEFDKIIRSGAKMPASKGWPGIRRGKFNSKRTRNEFYSQAAALARLHYANGDRNKADAVIKRFLHHSEIRMGRADQAVKQVVSIYSDFKQYDKLIQLCRRILEYTPMSHEIREKQAFAYEKLGKFNEAAQIYERMFFLQHPTDRGKPFAHDRYFYKKLGEAYAMEGKTDRALAIWRRIISRDRHRGDGSFGFRELIDLLRSHERYREAHPIVEQALLLYPHDVQMHVQNVEVLLKLGRHEDAVEALGRMQKTLPGSSHLRFVKETTLRLSREKGLRR